MDVIEELKFLGKFTTKKKLFFFWGGGDGRGQVGGGGRGVRVDVNEELGVGGGGVWSGERGGSGVLGRGGVWLGGQDGCERRIEVFVKIHKKKFGGGGDGEDRESGGGIVQKGIVHY